MRENVGNCYICEEPVFISKGQLFTKTATENKFTKEVVKEEVSHKQCRKQLKRGVDPRK